jgi:hypothetical protein
MLFSLRRQENLLLVELRVFALLFHDQEVEAVQRQAVDSLKTT